jgi:Putative zinc-finger
MKRDMHTRWMDQLSDYLDRSLSEQERVALEAHLARCPTCAGVLEEIREVVRQAGSLGEVPPTRDLWPAVAAALDEPRALEPEVIPLPTRRRAPGAGASGVYLSRRQLAAAAAVVALASSLATWALGPGLATRSVGSPLPEAPGAVTQVSRMEGPSPALSDELAHLEAALSAARSRLDPATVRILEKNLDVIDRAIQDSRRALATDPANPFLREHLQDAYRQKVEYLRQATTIAGWAG